MLKKLTVESGNRFWDDSSIKLDVVSPLSRGLFQLGQPSARFLRLVSLCLGMSAVGIALPYAAAVPAGQVAEPAIFAGASLNWLGKLPRFMPVIWS